MSTKTETALVLRSFGFKYIDIAAELYPQEYDVWRRTRDRRLYVKLVDRVRRLVRWAADKYPTDDGDNVLHQSLSDEVELDYSGGERDSSAHRAPLPFESPAERKKGKKGEERQVIEYEQLLYHYYRNYLSSHDYDMTIWSTAKYIHAKSFRKFYEKYRANVWGPRPRSDAARTYAYAVLVTASLVNGYLRPRFVLRDKLKPSKGLMEEVMSIVLSSIL